LTLEVVEKHLELLIGPQHPGSGHMRLVAKLDGDIIVGFDPDVGFVHRAVEKIAETKGYVQIIPLVERPPLVDCVNVNLGYVLALEKLLGVEPPPQASYLRVLAAELNRVASHLYGIAIHAIMIGSSTMFMWPLADREVLLELLQDLSGARVTYSYVIPGGVRRGLPEGFKEKALKAFRYLRRRLRDYDDLFLSNPVTVNRLRGVGVIEMRDAVNLGIVGPNLRASGVPYDVRRAEPYCVYSDLDFEVMTRREGDAYSRLLVRIGEIEQSMKIVEQCLDKNPSGPILHESFLRGLSPKARAYMEQTGRVRFPALFSALKPPQGEVSVRVEAGRGELFFYVVSDGSPTPYRLRMVTPSFRNLAAFRHVMVGNRLADIPAIYGSLDYFPPEADR